MCQAKGFGDGKAIYRARVSTWVQGDAACLVFNVAMLSCDAGALQGDICPVTAQRGSPCNNTKHFLSVSYWRYVWIYEYFEVFLGCGSKPEMMGARQTGQGHRDGVTNRISMWVKTEQQVLV